MNDLINRQQAINALDFNIVHMTVSPNDEKNITNPFAQYNKGLEDGIKALKALPSAEPDNQVHLCIFCKYSYPECSAEMSDVIFGNGIGHDNVCACAKFEIKPKRTAKIYKKQAPDGLYYFYCGVCGEMIDCSFYEDYKNIKSYCGYCGAKLDWSEKYD